MSGQRSLFTPHPIYGISKGGFTIADLPNSYDSGTVALTGVAVDTTSTPINATGNGIEVHPSFSNPVTSCSIQVIKSSDSSVIKQWDNVSMANANTCNLSYYDLQDLLGGVAVKIRAFNFVGGGSVTVKVRRLGQ